MHTHVRIQNGVYFPLRSHFRALFSHARMPHEQVNKLSFIQVHTLYAHQSQALVKNSTKLAPVPFTLTSGRVPS